MNTLESRKQRIVELLTADGEGWNKQVEEVKAVTSIDELNIKAYQLRDMAKASSAYWHGQAAREFYYNQRDQKAAWGKKAYDLGQAIMGVCFYNF